MSFLTSHIEKLKGRTVVAICGWVEARYFICDE
jgi:hypothetical protein